MAGQKKNRTSPTATNRVVAMQMPSQRGISRVWLVAAVLAVSIGAVYIPALNAPLIFDDVDTITRNESITAIQPLFGTKAKPGPLTPPRNIPTAARPLVNLTFAINFKFSQLNPTGYHATNAIIHFLSAMLLWAIVRRTLCLPYFAGRFDTPSGWLALAVAMIWALHPLQTEAVIYATQRTELMMALFYLATLYCSLRYWASTDRHQRVAWLTVATLACLAGMASKEVMVSAPLIVLLFDRALISGSLAGALRKSWPLYVALAATWILLLILSAGSPHGGAAGFELGPSVYIWWFTQAKILWLYLKLAIWPSPLLLHYQLPYVDTPGEVCLYVVPLLLLGIATLVLLWRNRPLGFLGTWIFAILAPTFFIPIVTEMAAERRMYLPLAALVVVFVVGAYQLAISMSSRRQSGREVAPEFRPVAIPLFVIAIVCGLASAKRLTAYQQPLGLWQQVLLRQPENDIAHHAIGKYLEDAGDVAAALPYFREVARLKPNEAQSHLYLGVLLTKNKAYDEAASEFAEGARIAPTDIRMFHNLSYVLVLAGRDEEALVALRAAIPLSPDDWTLYNNLADVLTRRGRHQEAIEACREALRLKPGGPNASGVYDLLADNYFKLNQPDQAIAALQRGLDLVTAHDDRIEMERFTKRIREKK